MHLRASRHRRQGRRRRRPARPPSPRSPTSTSTSRGRGKASSYRRGPRPSSRPSSTPSRGAPPSSVTIAFLPFRPALTPARSFALCLGPLHVAVRSLDRSPSLRLRNASRPTSRSSSPRCQGTTPTLPCPLQLQPTRARTAGGGGLASAGGRRVGARRRRRQRQRRGRRVMVLGAWGGRLSMAAAVVGGSGSGARAGIVRGGQGMPRRRRRPRWASRMSQEPVSTSRPLARRGGGRRRDEDCSRPTKARQSRAETAPLVLFRRSRTKGRLTGQTDRPAAGSL